MRATFDKKTRENYGETRKKVKGKNTVEKHDEKITKFIENPGKNKLTEENNNRTKTEGK